MSIDEARDLFIRLSRIQRQLSQSPDNAALSSAVSQIEAHTYDVSWRDEVASQAGIATSQWRIDALNSANARLERARESRDPIALGNMYVRHGQYRDASIAYQRTGGDVNTSLLASHLNTLQKNWALVLAGAGKSSAKVHDDTPLAEDLLLNLALAHWNLEEYSNCLSLLLRLSPSTAGNGGIWLTGDEIRGMLLVSAILTFDRPTLRYFARADPLSSYLHPEFFVDSFLHLDVERFWQQLSVLHFPPYEPPDRALSLVSTKLRQNWLYAHNKVPLPLILELYGAISPSHSYGLLDLIDDLREWRAPYKLDTVNGVVEASHLPLNTSETVEELARVFRRDTLLLLWQGQNANTTTFNAADSEQYI